MEPDNSVVLLCAEGMRAEAAGRLDDARRCFLRAWEARTDDFEACIAAHYLARHQDEPQETLRWNQEALARADAVGDERVRDFYPSLYLNLGWSHEQLGDEAEARRCSCLAATLAEELAADTYGSTVRQGAAKGLARTGAP
jgi:tetratricopeptide (TPR) repeat protein